MADPLEELPVEVRGLILDTASNAPIVLLYEPVGELLLPIWIGPFEATAISIQLEHQEVPRPLTHDLLLTALGIFDAAVEKVVITDLRESTFFAEIHLRRAGESILLDARPSDAIALALRADRPVLVRRGVLEKAQVHGEAESKQDAEERLRRMLEELDPDDLGKYTM